MEMKKHMSKIVATALAAAMVVPMISSEAFAYDRQEAATVSGGTVVSVYSGTQNSNDQGNYLEDPGDYVKVNTFKTSGTIESTSNITSTTNYVENVSGGVVSSVRGGNEGVSWEGNTLTLNNAKGTVITIEGPEINPYEVNTYNDKLNPAISDGDGSSDLSWAENLTYFKQYDLFTIGGNSGAPHTKDNTTTKDTVYVYLIGENSFNNIVAKGNVNVVFVGTGSLTLDASQSWDYDDYNDPDFDHLSDCSTQALATITSSGYHGNLSGETETVPMENARFKETVTEWYEYDLPEFTFANGMYIAEGGKYYDEAVVGTTDEHYNIYQSYVGTNKGPASKVVIKCRDLFDDVAGSNIKTEPDYQYYFDPVYWAADNGITKGYSDNTFRPQNECTRAEMMNFLWRMAGCPTEDANGNSYGEAKDYFNDIEAKEGSDTSKAIAWGYKTGITKGYSDGSFGYKKSVSRLEAMIFLYRLAGKPDVDASAEMKFSDVVAANYNKNSDSYKSVLWGSTLGITKGYSKGEYKGQFGINLPCLREAIITFLYRFNQNVDYNITVLSADDAIKQVSTIGFVDLDGAKISTVVVEYNVDLTGAEVTKEMFTVDSYGSDLGNERCALGSDPGMPLKAYVNDKPEASEDGGSGTGKYVIIELNTDYQLSSVTGGAGAYNVVMDASVLQTGTIVTDNYKITPATEEVRNWEEVQGTRYGSPVTYEYAIEGQYEIQGLDIFELHTKDGSTGYEAYHATNCFDEATGEYSDVDLPYALYVPEDYDPSKKYGLVLHIHDASAMGDNPVITLTESKAPVNYASEEVQQMAKDQGLAGLIVVCPQFNDSIRTARDNWSLSCGVSATWQLLDYLTSTYNVDTNRIYASGQSMGGMQVMAMAQQRDNYFAAIWPIASQWGTNYNLSTEYQGSVYYETPADGTIVWKTDCDGNEVNYRNMYYMLSDDNILVLNCADDMLSSYLWKEYYLLYKDLVNVEIPKGYWNPLTLTADEQDAELEKLLAQDNETGIYWAVMDGGSHGDSWVYAHKIMGCYKWLLSQTRETENERGKLDLNKEFELADTQNQTDEYLMISKEAEGDNEGFTIYYKTGKAGSGTLGYNSTLYGRGGQTIEALPGWDPSDPSTYGLGYYVFSFD